MTKITIDKDLIEQAIDALANVKVTGPDDDGVIWINLPGNGVTGKAILRVGKSGLIAAQCATLFDEQRVGAIAALRAALAEPAVELDPCPGCKKGVVCRTPSCGRLKLKESPLLQADLAYTSGKVFHAKFNVGDHVWYMKDNKPTEVVVSAIEVFFVDTNQDRITYNAKNVTNSVSWLDHTKLLESSLFRSKAELLESL